MSKSVVRSVKNVTKGYSTVQVKVRNATSNDAWGPTGTEMSEIAQMTFNGSVDFNEIMEMLDKRLNDKGKNWRHVLKSLKVLDYVLHEGSEMVVTWARKNVYIIKTLREFQYVDDDGRDVGQTVRVSAKELTSLIMDEERLRTERSDRRTWKSRVTGLEDFNQQGMGSTSGGEGHQTRRPERRPKQRNEEEDLEYRLALEASKNEMEEDKKRRESRATPSGQDEDLEKAIRLSKEEEELRRRELEDSNANSLFDASPVTNQQPQYTGFNQGYQQQSEVDWYGNIKDQQPQQPQSTGFLNNVYGQGMPNQQTGFQNGFQQQPTGFDQMQSQQMQPNYMQPQQTLQPQQTMQPQQTAFNTTNPYSSQPNGFGQFQQQQQQQQEQQASPTAGSHNPWAQQNQADQLKPMPTGSNNPFASSFNKPLMQQTTSAPTLNTLNEQRTATQFNQQKSSYNPIANYQSPQQNQSPMQQQPFQQPSQPLQQQRPQETDPTKARLNALLASGEGMDTFGNTGESRIPAQHTAPGTFVNSAGQNLNRLHSTQTGNNPFFSQQFTGAPQQHPGFGGQQGGMMPTQTGPAGMQGFGGGNNPFGAQGNRQGQGGGSLIDL